MRLRVYKTNRTKIKSNVSLHHQQLSNGNCTIQDQIKQYSQCSQVQFISVHFLASVRAVALCRQFGEEDGIVEELRATAGAAAADRLAVGAGT